MKTFVAYITVCVCVIQYVEEMGIFFFSPGI